MKKRATIIKTITTAIAIIIALIALLVILLGLGGCGSICLLYTSINDYARQAGDIEHSERRDAAQQRNDMNLQLDYKGSVACTIGNFYAIMTHDSRYAGVKFNMVSNRPEVHTPDGSVLLWTDTDDALSRAYIESKWHIHSKDKHRDAFLMLLREREYNPVRDMIDALVWDGTPRIGQFLTVWGKAEDTAYTREVSRLIFAGGINRAYKDVYKRQLPRGEVTCHYLSYLERVTLCGILRAVGVGRERHVHYLPRTDRVTRMTCFEIRSYGTDAPVVLHGVILFGYDVSHKLFVGVWREGMTVVQCLRLCPALRDIPAALRLTTVQLVAVHVEGDGVVPLSLIHIYGHFCRACREFRHF